MGENKYIKGLHEFWRRCIGAADWGLEVSPGDAQEWGLELGLIHREGFDPEIHDDPSLMGDFEPDDPIYLDDVPDNLAELNAALAQPSVDVGALAQNIVASAEIRFHIRKYDLSEPDWDHEARGKAEQWIESVLRRYLADAPQPAVPIEALAQTLTDTVNHLLDQQASTADITSSIAKQLRAHLTDSADPVPKLQIATLKTLLLEAVTERIDDDDNWLRRVVAVLEVGDDFATQALASAGKEESDD